MSTVLDAGELAGDASKLLAFTAGFAYLRSKGVPVVDVIAMAKAQKRRINLAWSPARWQAEHDRLSRAETLRQLAGVNQGYDLTGYREHLPASFPGYLIGGSRRLGMEGLRQRHCVAGYHERVQRGVCAIATVFVNRQRWTVQLVKTDDPDAPLRIAQIKTRLNGVASIDVRNTIYSLLGIAPPRATSQSTAAGEKQYTYMDNLRRVLPLLREHHVGRVTVRFEGSGDSGNIDDAVYDTEIDDDAINVEINTTKCEWMQDGWIYVQGTATTTLREAIENIAEDYLERTEVNWYNDDGGFGDLVIDVNKGIVEIDVNQRFNQIESAYSEIVDIETAEAM